MDYTGERYVRLYVRDTLTWQRLGWEGQAVLCLLMRKLDRSGVFELGGLSPVEGVTISLLMPREIVERGMTRLLEMGVFEQGDLGLVMPNFLEAQEAVQTDAHRAREYRARRRDKARNEQSVTKRDDEVTKRDVSVTLSHAASRGVTPSRTVPYRTKEEDPSDLLVPDGTNGTNGHSVVTEEKITPEDLMENWNAVCVPLGLPRVKEVKGTRREKALRRLREHPSEDFWRDVFGAFRNSLFLQGRKPSKNHPHWKPDFDWLVENDYVPVRITEGRYA